MVKGIDSEKFIKDIINITNLVLTLGKNYTFVHRTIQEYFTASYIQHSLDDDATMVYNAVRENKKLVNWWRQPLLFLRDIDSFRYTKYYFIPTLESSGLFELSSGDYKPANNLENYFNIDVKITLSKATSSEYSFTGGVSVVLEFKDFHDELMGLKSEMSKMVKGIISKQIESKGDDLAKLFEPNQDEHSSKRNVRIDNSQISFEAVRNKILDNPKYLNYKKLYNERKNFVSEYEKERSASSELANIINKTK